MKKKILFILLTCILIGTTSLNTMATPISSSQCPSNNPYHILVNKQNSLSSSYKPSNLVIPNVTFQTPGNIEKNYMEATAAKALEELFAAAKAQNIRLVAISGYRSYTRQATLYKNAVSTYGKTQMGTAKPGQSAGSIKYCSCHTLSCSNLSESVLLRTYEKYFKTFRF